MEASTLDGHLLSSVTHKTVTVRLGISGDHHETLTFYLIGALQLPVILGFTRFIRHNPHILWSYFGQDCHAVCLGSALPPTPADSSAYEFPDLLGVPSEYLDLKEVFNKAQATPLPSHRPYDCDINVFPGTSQPKGRLYSLSDPEPQAKEKYQQLPGSRYHLALLVASRGRPLLRGQKGQIPPSLHRLPGSQQHHRQKQVSSKVDFRNAYHLVHINEVDELKTAFNTPSGHYDLLVWIWMTI